MKPGVAVSTRRTVLVGCCTVTDEKGVDSGGMAGEGGAVLIC
jgi:hypothetical protein